MKLGRYDFSPTIVPSIVTLAFLVLLIWLGNWQLGRAEYKYNDRELRSSIDTSKTLNLKADMDKTKDVLARHVVIKGSFDDKHVAFVANIKYKGRPGFFVLVPMKFAGSDMHILVLRGWTKQLRQFNVIPKVKSPSNVQRELEAIVDKPPVVGIKKGQPDEGYAQWPKIITYVDVAWYESKLGVKFLPYVLREKGESTVGIIRDWASFPAASLTMPPEKHTSYAFQWFSLAAVLLIIYLVVNSKRRSDDAESETDSGD